MTRNTHHPSPDRPPEYQAPPPRCPNCGYNLTGICTVDRPDGGCPECGTWYTADTVYRQRRGGRRTVMIVGLVLQLLLLPLAVLFLSIMWLGSLSSTDPAMLFIAPLLTAVPFALLMAWQYRVLCRLGVPRELRSSPWPMFLLSTLLFTAALAALATVYFCGGCLFILSQLNI